MIATTHVGSKWVRAVHLVQVGQTARAAEAARPGGDGEAPIQVFDPLFALQLVKTLSFMRAGKALPMALGLLRGLSAATPTQARAAGAGTHCAVSFIGGPTCMYPFMDQHDYDVLRSASSVGRAFHQHYYRKGRGLAYYQITAEAAGSRIF